MLLEQSRLRNCNWNEYKAYQTKHGMQYKSLKAKQRRWAGCESHQNDPTFFPHNFYKNK